MYINKKPPGSTPIRIKCGVLQIIVADSNDSRKFLLDAWAVNSELIGINNKTGTID